MQLLNNIQKLNVDGNIIALSKLQNNLNLSEIETNIRLRKDIVQNLKNKVDTLMVYQKNNEGISYIAFEPNHSDIGAITTVCGNGLKAIVSVIPDEDIILLTKAGNFPVKKNKSKTFIQCGKFVTGKKIEELFLYISKKELKKSIGKLCRDFTFYSPIVAIGCNVENDNFVGEPHIVIGTFERMDSKKLIMFAEKCGLFIRDSGFMKIESNITFFSFKNLAFGKCQLQACTFERHLGNDPAIAITGSCGTGSMAASNVFINFFLGKKPKKIISEVSFPNGTLRVEINKGKTFLEGRCSYEKI